MNENDKRFTRIVDENTILIDFSSARAQVPSLAGMARAVGWRCWFDNGDPFGFTNDDAKRLHVYHMKSVHKKIFIVSTQEMTPGQTQPIAKNYVDLGVLQWLDQRTADGELDKFDNASTPFIDYTPAEGISLFHQGEPVEMVSVRLRVDKAPTVYIVRDDNMIKTTKTAPSFEVRKNEAQA